MDYSTLKEAVQAVIRANGNNEITGPVLQSALMSMINSLGAAYQFAGIAYDWTTPGTPDHNVAYIAGPGTYPNFNAAFVPDESVGVFMYDGTWTIQITDIGRKILTPVDYLKNSLFYHYVLPSLVWSSNGYHRHIVIPVTAGQIYKITGGDEATSFAWLVSHAQTSTAGDPAPVVEGSSVITVPANGTIYAEVPETARYMCIRSGNTNTGTGREALPASIYLAESELDKIYEDLAEMSQEIDELSGEIENITYPMDRITRPYSILSTGKYGTSTSYNHYVVKVTEGMKIALKATSGRYGFTTMNDNPVSGGDIPLVSGQTMTDITAETVVEVPAGAAFMVTNFTGVEGFVSTLKIDQQKKDEATLGMLAQVLSYGVKFNGFDKVTLRNGTITNAGNAQAVCQNAVLAINGSEEIGIYTDRPLPEGHYYKYFNGTYSRTSGAVNSTNLRRYTVPGTSVKSNIIKPPTLDSVATGFAFGIVEYDENDTIVPIRTLDFFGYNVWIVRTATAGGEEEDRTSILWLNNEYEWRPKMLSARKRYYTSSVTNKPHPTTIAHISDIHSNWPNVQRFLEFCDYYSSLIDLRVNTGDTVLDSFSSTALDGYAAISGVGSIINITGNHDTSRYEGGVRDWRYYCGLPVYNALIAPYVSGWGVVQPSGAAANGYCYFYKDIASKLLRVVFVDIMAYDATQDAWLATVLEGAKTNGYHVLIATHFAGSTAPGHGEDPTFTKVPCNYTTIYGLGGSSSSLNSYNPNAYLMMATVQNWIDGGGVFVGYIQGHYHADFVAKVAAYPSQLIFSIGSSKAGEVRDYNHIVGTRMQDEFQIVSVDTYLHTIKCYKVGANVDLYGRHKNSICVDYLSGDIISEGY